MLWLIKMFKALKYYIEFYNYNSLNRSIPLDFYKIALI